jgi:predicted nucleic acid-binding protein
MGTVADRLLGYRRVGLDPVCFIYHLGRHPEYVEVTTEIFDLVETGKLTAVTSTLTLLMILTRAKMLGHQAAADSYRAVLTTFPNLELRRSDFSIADLASDLRVRYRIGAPEAIQIATAIVEGAGAYLCDDPTLSRVVELDVVLLRDLRQSGVHASQAMKEQ